ncbi:short transient receptor potential channel 5 isoform X2 [Nematostella vectensis]|uniref:short transient receptor potential channel 5 isoform X2 n=1 Tax=Nematostella vectensis TaxID=45351 RepID=UPI0020773797|nr:short transient receptor potential channel 5 isoform X2 [Nematostella vectensis]
MTDFHLNDQSTTARTATRKIAIKEVRGFLLARGLSLRRSVMTDELRPRSFRHSTLESKRGRVRTINRSDLERVKLEDRTSNERALFDYVLTGRVKDLKGLLTDNPKLDLSSADRNFTRLLLRTAIEANNADVFEVLVTNGAKIRSSLFTAVGRGSKECAEVILAYYRPECGDTGPEDFKKGRFVTPLIMAAQYEEFDMIEFFVSRGYKVSVPGCTERDELDMVFVNKQEQGNSLRMQSPADDIALSSIVEQPQHTRRERMALLKINSYKALANPLYISYTYIYDRLQIHPLFQVFKLNEELLLQAKKDPEFKSEYRELSESCEQFAVDLLDQCRTLNELDVMTDVIKEIDERYKKSARKYIQVLTKDAEELAVLKLAIRNNNDKFVAHPYSQLHLNTVLYRGIYRLFDYEVPWGDRGDLSRVLFAIRHIVLLPFLAFIHILLPHSRPSRFLSNPVIKFMSHTASFYFFVLLLIFSSFQDLYEDNVTSPSKVEWAIFAWVIGLFCQEVRELYLQGVRCFIQQWWNVTGMLMVTLFLMSITLRVIAYGITGHWEVLNAIASTSPSSWYELTLLSNSFFSIAMVLSFIRLSGAFQVNSILGPLQLSLYHLLVDILKFLVFFVLIFMAFGFSLRRLYSNYISTQKYIAKNKPSSSNTTLNGTRSDTEHQFTDVGSGLNSLFWSVFGLTELNSFGTNDAKFTITKETGEVMFGFFQVIAVIVAVNMLIAMMTRSFESIAEQADVKWKVSRTRLWMSWIQKGSGCLPPPLNLIPNPPFILRGVRQFSRWVIRCCCRKKKRIYRKTIRRKKTSV